MVTVQLRMTLEQVDRLADAAFAESERAEAPEDAIALQADAARLRNAAARARVRAAQHPAG